jgi:hypothetical protein
MAKARELEPWNEARRSEAASHDPAGARLRAARGALLPRAGPGEAARARQALGYEVCLHEVERESGGGDFHLARLIDDLSGGGLFAARRAVIVRNPGDLLRKIDGEDSALARAALAFVQSPEDAGTLVLADASLRADHALVKAILKAGGLAPSFRKLWDSPPPWKPDPLQTELVLWTQRRASELGLRLTGQQALYVSAATGNDLAALDDQLETLRASGGRDVRASVSWTAGATPWVVADHVLGDLARSLSGIEALFRGGFQEGGKRLLDARRSPQNRARCSAARARLRVARAQRGLPGTRPSAGREAAEAPAALGLARVASAATLERALKSGAGLDANDFARLALRWALGASRPAPSGARG